MCKRDLKNEVQEYISLAYFFLWISESLFRFVSCRIFKLCLRVFDFSVQRKLFVRLLRNLKMPTCPGHWLGCLTPSTWCSPPATVTPQLLRKWTTLSRPSAGQCCPLLVGGVWISILCTCSHPSASVLCLFTEMWLFCVLVAYQPQKGLFVVIVHRCCLRMCMLIC